METTYICAAIKSENWIVGITYYSQNRKNYLLKGITTECAARIFLQHCDNSTWNAWRAFIKKNGKKTQQLWYQEKKKRMVDEGQREKEVPRRRRNGPKLRCFPAQEDASVYTQKAVPGIISICRAFMLCSELCRSLKQPDTAASWKAVRIKLEIK